MIDMQLPQPAIQEILRQHTLDEKTHGFKHAHIVEELTKLIAHEPEFSNIEIDFVVLSAAAMLHDVGYSRVKLSWRPGQTEHVMESVNIAKEYLSTVPPFDKDSDRLRIVCYLIRYHDETNHAFPIYHPKKNLAIPISTNREETEWPFIYLSEFKRAEAMLSILKEADARTSTGLEGARKTLEYSLSRNIPLISNNEYNPLNAWYWEESAVGNVRLGAKRAILDAYTEQGKKLAWNHYIKAEKLIKQSIKDIAIYQPEIHLASLENVSPSADYDRFWIRHVYPWDAFVEIFRSIKLQGDESLMPYQDAVIENKIVDIDELFPTAFYISRADLRKVERLCDDLLKHYCLSPFDMSTMIDISNYKLKSRRIDVRTTPPIVEVYTEKNGKYKGERIAALVDGLHRCYLAKLHGITKIRAVVISHIPESMPLVPLPLSWNDVKVFDGVPEIKRDYRFKDISEFPDISSFSSVKIIPGNFRYFFYRDLKPIGSEGVRKIRLRKSIK